MLIAIGDNVHFKLGGVVDWFGIICYWPLIAQLLPFGLTMISYACLGLYG